MAVSRFALITVALCGLCLSCGSWAQQRGTVSKVETSPSPSVSPTPVIKPCPTEQKLDTVAGELKIHELSVSDPVRQNHVYEITLNGKSLNKETSYCALIDKQLGQVNGNDVVLVSLSMRPIGESLADGKNTPIGPDSMYKLIALKPDGSFWLSRTFGNGAPYAESRLEKGKIVIRFQDAYLLDDPNRYNMAYEETWVYQNGRLSKTPKRRR